LPGGGDHGDVLLDGAGVPNEGIVLLDPGAGAPSGDAGGVVLNGAGAE
jgi:hypothetical protein